jgi:peptidoglycan/LPS O-acetylase OafA/YrhL
MNVARPALYRPQLDALRAIAVIAVLVHHFLPVAKFIPEDFLTLGLLAVRLFFVLSGYLITGILLRSKRQPLPLAFKQFYIRRTLRIFPIYYLTLAILVLLNVGAFRNFIFWHLLYASNILFALTPNAALSGGHLWSLSVEEQFYWLWPPLILLTPYMYLHKLITGTLVFGLLWKFFVAFGLSGHSYPMVDSQLAGGILMPACLDSLALGALLALIEHDENLKRYRGGFLRTSLRIGVLIVFCQVVLYLTQVDMRFFWATSYLGVSLIFVCLVGRASEGFAGNLGTLLSWRPLLYVGKISYGIYLYHNFMPGLTQYIFRLVGWSQSHSHMDVLVSASAATVLTLLISALSWHFIERPINSLKDRYGGLQQSVPRLVQR